MLALSLGAAGMPAKSPPPMVWGTATASYQVEGFRSADGRQPSLWDAFDTTGVSKSVPAYKPNGQSNVHEGENAAAADMDYTLFNSSADLTQSYGFGAARMSISWTRVMTYTAGGMGRRPTWTRNEAGLAHYRSVLSAYASRGIAIALTIFHWDLPLALEEYALTEQCGSAWLCPWIADEFADYSRLLYAEFGAPRFNVRWWITINEPLTIVENGYAAQYHAPGRCGNRTVCWHGDNLIEPYMAAKHLILAHGRAFREWEAAGKPGAGCGITLNGDWREPMSSSAADKAAAVRSIEWQVPLFADPIRFGKWTPSIEAAIGARMANFTGAGSKYEPSAWAWSAAELAVINGSHDGHFFMNSYTSNFAQAAADTGCGWACDAAASSSGYSFTTGAPIGTPSSNGWLYNYGTGIKRLIEWYNRRYPGATFIVTENGWGNQSQTPAEDIHDMERCNFYRDYIGNVSAAHANGAKVGAYFAWSLMDNYEWADGFSTRFGLTYVDYSTMVRTPKLSAAWFKKHVTPLASLPTDGQPFPPCDPALLAEAKLKA